MKLYQDKKWLEEQYWGQGKSVKQIAKEMSVCGATIFRHLNRHKIPHKRVCNGSIDKQWLCEQYLEKKKSAVQISQGIKHTQSAVNYWLHRHNIQTRTLAESVHVAKRNNVNITQHLLEMLEGEILGDGHIGVSTKSYSSARYTHSSKYLSYVSWLSNVFALEGLEQSGRLYRTVLTSARFGKSYYMWDYATLYYEELAEIRRRFYPQGKKVVPRDLELTPISARQWYIGDGSLCTRKSRNAMPHIVLSTCAFDRQSIKTLMEQLSKRLLKASHEKSKNIIYISVHSVEDFLRWIGPCPPEIAHIYAYKWDLNRTCSIPEWQEQYKQQHNIA